MVPGLATTRAPSPALHIVVVEDSTADAELLQAMLEIELPGAVVTTAPTLAGGLLLLTPSVNAVITDLSLPDADGLAALYALRAAVPDTAVLVLTGRSDREVGMAAITAGADDYLVKGSLDSRSLATAVQYAVQRRTVVQVSRRFERLAMSLLDAMDSPTCAVDRSGRITAVNKAWGSFLALSTNRSDVGTSYPALCDAATAIDSPSRAALAHGLQDVLDGATSRFQLDYSFHTPEGTSWFSARITPLPDGEGAVLTHVDVSLAKRAEQALSHQALHDGLTDLPNRELLAVRLAEAMTQAGRTQSVAGVCFLDLDQFKRVNDSLGHQAGDDLLLAVSRRLRAALRPTDTLARFAGDEFVVVWPDLPSAAEAERLAERLRALFDEPFHLTQATLSLTASIGVAVGAAPQLPDQLLLAADAAMYDAKSRGRGCTRMFTDELRDGAATRLRVEAELRVAVERQQFVLHYQPVVDLRLGTVRGVEALVRWNHPDGLRAPDTFIPVAEACGMIVPLGAWVLNEACRQAAAWQRDGLDLDVAVNLSVRQVSHPDMLTTIREALATSGLEPHRLMLEVTESVMFEDAEAAQVALSKIAALGATIAIDDFGTGYSSLLYLKRYPVRALKVDRSFVSGMAPGNDDHAIVTSVVSLARAVGSTCIAEGVETEAQYAALQAMGCDYAQGYLLGRPVPAAELPSTVRACDDRLRPPSAAAPEVPAVPHPRVASSVVERIGQLHAEGASLHTIAAALNREHAPRPGTVRWHAATVAQVIAGSYRPPSRRRVPATRRAAEPAVARPTGHRALLYATEPELSDQAADVLAAALDAAEAVLIIAPPTERAALEGELRRRGHDLEALSATTRYQAWDAEEVLARISVDGYLSGRLFRQVVEQDVESAQARFGRISVYGGLAGALWARGDVACCLALEQRWQQFVERAGIDLLCGYRSDALDTMGDEADRSCLHGLHLQPETAAV